MKGILNKLLGRNSAESCPNNDCQKVAGMMHAVIDDEVTEAEMAFFKEHLDDCQHCLDKYDVEKGLLSRVREKLTRKCCPEKTMAQIKAKIKEA